jgi:hypothetical protein
MTILRRPSFPSLILTMSEPLFPLFCIGNPLLDIQVTNGEELLKKYDLKANDAILASAEKHAPLYLIFSFLLLSLRSYLRSF